MLPCQTQESRLFSRLSCVRLVLGYDRRSSVRTWRHFRGGRLKLPVRCRPRLSKAYSPARARPRHGHRSANRDMGNPTRSRQSSMRRRSQDAYRSPTTHASLQLHP